MPVPMVGRAVHESEILGSEFAQLAHNGRRVGGKRRSTKHGFSLHRRRDDVIGGDGWPVAQSCEQITTQERCRGLFEEYACLPTVRDMRCVDMAHQLSA